MPTFGDRLKHAWNAFAGKDQIQSYSIGAGSAVRADRPRLRFGSERSIINSVYTRIAIDSAAISIHHAKLDENGRYLGDVTGSNLNYIFSTEANIDQTGRAFIQDAVMSLMDEGCIALVPIDTTINPNISDAFKIDTIRVGRITQWYPAHVRVEVYNDKTGRKEEILMPKKTVAIVENPLYSVMNEPNSTLQRLIRKLAMLDSVDEATSTGKLDIIVQLPYTIKSDARRQQAEERRKNIEMQLSGSKYGIAYVDATEKITQLNRTLDNNLLKQIEYLTSMLYSQLGLTEEVFKGNADEKTMLNYYNRTIEPILSALCDEMRRKFLTKTARTQHQSIVFFRDPFRLVPVENLAEIADKFTRNEILASNEFRGILGFKPSDDPRADELRNSNLNPSYDAYPSVGSEAEDGYDDGYEDVETGPLEVSIDEL